MSQQHGLSFFRSLSEKLSNTTSTRWLFRLYAPYLGAGIRVTDIAEDYSYMRVEMPLRWYNRNYFGTQFGGSLYAMVDPIYCLMLVQQLGTNYIVWDKGADINFVSPGKGTVHAEFFLSKEEVESLREQAANGSPVIPHYTVDVKDRHGNVVAHIEKRLYIRKKQRR